MEVCGILLQKLVQVLSVKDNVQQLVPVTSHEGILAPGVEGSAASLDHFTWGNGPSTNLTKFWLGPLNWSTRFGEEIPAPVGKLIKILQSSSL